LAKLQFGLSGSNRGATEAIKKPLHDESATAFLLEGARLLVTTRHFAASSFVIGWLLFKCLWIPVITVENRENNRGEAFEHQPRHGLTESSNRADIAATASTVTRQLAVFSAVISHRPPNPLEKSEERNANF